MIKPQINGTKVVFGPCRLSHAHLFKKYVPEGDGGEGKYTTAVLIPKDDKETIKALRSAVEAAKTAGIVSKWKGAVPKKLTDPISDGDEKEDTNYEGHWYVNAKCNTRPGIVDRNMNPITDEEDMYSGVWALVSVTFYAYDTNGNKGVACGLNNLMKWKDGDRLGGRVSAQTDFGNLDLTDEDEDDL